MHLPSTNHLRADTKKKLCHSVAEWYMCRFCGSACLWHPWATRASAASQGASQMPPRVPPGRLQGPSLSHPSPTASEPPRYLSECFQENSRTLPRAPGSPQSPQCCLESYTLVIAFINTYMCLSLEVLDRASTLHLCVFHPVVLHLIRHSLGYVQPAVWVGLAGCRAADSTVTSALQLCGP